MAIRPYERQTRVTATTSTVDSLTPVVDREMTRWSIPGIVVGVLRDGAVDTRAFGVAKLSNGEAMREDSLFRVASISKVFTATLTMILADDGLLDIDRPIIEYLPDLPLADATARQTLTVRMLLSHQSGLYGDFFIDMGRARTRWRAHREVRRAAADDRSGRALGLLQQRLPLDRTRAGGRRRAAVDVLMRERLFTPSGPGAHLLLHARGHRLAARRRPHPVSPARTSMWSRAGLPAQPPASRGVVTNAPELLRFAALHLGDGTLDGTRVLSAESAMAMRTPQIKAANFADQWGIGWDIRDFGGTQVVSHGGSINGFQTHLTLVPEQGVAIAILTNSARGSAAVRNIEPAALEQVCGLRAPERPHVTLSDAELARFAGRYEQPGSRIAISAADGGLVVELAMEDPTTHELTPYPTVPLAPIGDAEFHRHGRGDGGLAGQFHFDAGGDGVRFVQLGGRLADRVA